MKRLSDKVCILVKPKLTKDGRSAFLRLVPIQMNVPIRNGASVKNQLVQKIWLILIPRPKVLSVLTSSQLKRYHHFHILQDA